MMLFSTRTYEYLRLIAAPEIDVDALNELAPWAGLPDFVAATALRHQLDGVLAWRWLHNPVLDVPSNIREDAAKTLSWLTGRGGVWKQAAVQAQKHLTEAGIPSSIIGGPLLYRAYPDVSGADFWPRQFSDVDLFIPCEYYDALTDIFPESEETTWRKGVTEVSGEQVTLDIRCYKYPWFTSDLVDLPGFEPRHALVFQDIQVTTMSPEAELMLAANQAYSSMVYHCAPLPLFDLAWIAAYAEKLINFDTLESLIQASLYHSQQRRKHVNALIFNEPTSCVRFVIELAAKVYPSQKMSQMFNMFVNAGCNLPTYFYYEIPKQGRFVKYRWCDPLPPVEPLLFWLLPDATKPEDRVDRAVWEGPLGPEQHLSILVPDSDEENKRLQKKFGRKRIKWHELAQPGP